jgi:hypothetical protein
MQDGSDAYSNEVSRNACPEGLRSTSMYICSTLRPSEGIRWRFSTHKVSRTYVLRVRVTRGRQVNSNFLRVDRDMKVIHPEELRGDELGRRGLTAVQRSRVRRSKNGYLYWANEEEDTLDATFWSRDSYRANKPLQGRTSRDNLLDMQGTP